MLDTTKLQKHTASAKNSRMAVTWPWLHSWRLWEPVLPCYGSRQQEHGSPACCFCWPSTFSRSGCSGILDAHSRKVPYKEAALDAVPEEHHMWGRGHLWVWPMSLWTHIASRQTSQEAHEIHDKHACNCRWVWWQEMHLHCATRVVWGLDLWHQGVQILPEVSSSNVQCTCFKLCSSSWTAERVSHCVREDCCTNVYFIAFDILNIPASPQKGFGDYLLPFHVDLTKQWFKWT